MASAGELAAVKAIAAIILSSVLSAVAAGEGTTAGTMKFLQSYDRVRITVALDGRPLKNTILEIIPLGGVLLLSVPTKENGVPELPLLAPGKYWIIARHGSTRSAGLCLNIEMSAVGEVSSFAMDLVPDKTRLRGLPDDPEAVCEGIVIERIRQFRGTVVDSNGARVWGASIKLFGMGSRQAAPVHVTSAKDGSFAASVRDGQYFALFAAHGFRQVLLVLQVSKKESARDLQIPMQVEAMFE